LGIEELFVETKATRGDGTDLH